MRRHSSWLGFIAVAVAALLPAGARAAPDRTTTYEVRTLERSSAPSARIAVAVRGGRVVLDRRRQVLTRRRGGRTQRIALRGRHGGGFRAVAHNRADRRVYVLGRRSVLAFDARGALRMVADLRPLGLRAPRTLRIAPTKDSTDPPLSSNLYIADRDAEVEAALASTPAAAAAVEEVPARHIQSIPTSAFSPPSPDPSGIAYDQATDSFFIVDSEVDEMPIYDGFNMFTSARGALTGTGIGTSLTFASKEPVGLGYDPASRTLYVADDDKDRVTMLQAGADGRFGTADDAQSFFGTLAFGSGDAEGVEFDPATGHVFVCDGLGREVYDVDPVNGVFGDGDDRVKSFDVAVYGMRDCEGIGIDPARGVLLAVDPYIRKLYELTKAGALVRVVDLSAFPAKGSATLASVVVAPSSGNPATPSYWLVDRQVDNGDDPSENDGLLHEFAIPGAEEPEPEPEPVVLTVPVRAGGDDATELSTRTVRRGTGTLELGRDRTVGMRFTGLSIPAGATVTRASVQFRADASASQAATLRIRAQASDDAPGFTTARANVSSRPLTAADASWSVPGWNRGTAQRSPDLAAVLREVVRRPGWSPGNDLALVITGSGRRVADSFEGGAPPVLTVEYVPAAAPAPTPTPTPTPEPDPTPAEGVVSIPARAGADDASEIQDGTVRRDTGDLELGSDKDSPATTTGVRFAGVGIPAGSTITGAFVQFQVDEHRSTAASLEVRAQAADDAAAFAFAPFDVSSRPVTTASAAWDVAAWPTVGEAGAAQRTPELRAVVQQVVNRPGWVSGNDLAVVLTGSGRRTAESFEGGAPPVLVVEYRSP